MKRILGTTVMRGMLAHGLQKVLKERIFQMWPPDEKQFHWKGVSLIKASRFAVVVAFFVLVFTTSVESQQTQSQGIDEWSKMPGDSVITFFGTVWSRKFLRRLSELPRG